MAGELVERLRKPWDGTAGARARRDAERAEAADRIEALECENATLRAERDEARKAAIDQAVQVALDHAEGAIRLSKLADADGDKESSRVHVNDAFALRAIAAAIRNMGGGENES